MMYVVPELLLAEKKVEKMPAKSAGAVALRI
jgi:hypothetical protein